MDYSFPLLLVGTQIVLGPVRALGIISFSPFVYFSTCVSSLWLSWTFEGASVGQWSLFLDCFSCSILCPTDSHWPPWHLSAVSSAQAKHCTILGSSSLPHTLARMLAAQEETWSSHRAHLMFSPFQGSLFPDVQCLNILLSFSFPKESDFGHCYCILAKSGISPLT